MVVEGTVYEAFRRTAARYPDNEFLCVLAQTAARYSIEARSYTYTDAVLEVAELERRYRAAGLAVGQRVGLMLENRPAFFFHWLALNALGVSVVPINPEWRSAELEYLVGHSEICVAVVPFERVEDLRLAGVDSERKLVVTTPDLASLGQVAGAQHSAVDRDGATVLSSVHAGPAGRCSSGTSGADNLAARATVVPHTIPSADTECALLYTSGTTGRPKGCVLPNEYFLWAGTWYAKIGGLCGVAPGKERLITPLPMSHMNAMAFSTMVMLLTGGCVVPLDRFHPGTWWNSVRESRATIVHYLGVMPAMLLGAAPDDSDRMHSVRFGFGAGVSPRLHAAFEERFGFPLLEAWAMTETGAGAVVIANHEPRKVGTACFGKTDSRVDWRLVDEAGQDVAVGQPGELLVRCAGDLPRFGFFREYLKDPEATAAAWADGYFHTGDMVSIDADGDFHFIDRKKNVIRRSGENISAVEVEGVLLQHPKVAGVGVMAVPDEVRGDEVMACVVPRGVLEEAEREALARELVQFCLGRLAYFKAPGYVALCERLPLTPTEKIQRAQLKELGRTLFASEACVDLRSLKKRTPVAS
jgi:acyl-CoA synthetase (AMP-forming)/AMP-acid ligase II